MSLKGFLGHFRRAIDRQDCEARVSEPEFCPSGTSTDYITRAWIRFGRCSPT